jgi:hypothetical protein
MLFSLFPPIKKGGCLENTLSRKQSESRERRSIDYLTTRAVFDEHQA